jgi:putative DNA primase/helicase
MSTPAFDLDTLRNAIDADKAGLCDALGLRPDGNRYLCPACQCDGKPHADGDFSIDAGFKCHRCGWSGDGLALVRTVKGCDFPAAVEFVRSVYRIHAGATTAPTPKQKTTKANKTHPTIDDAAKAAAWGAERNKGHKWTPTRCDVYTDAGGKAVAAEVRLDRADGAVDDLGKPIKTFCTMHAVKNGWRKGDPPGKWPPFNLPAVLASEDTVFIPEGPKSVEAAMRIGLTATTSAYGKDNPKKTDWTTLHGRDVALLPDNDPDGGGMKYADAVAALCQKAGARSVKIVMLPGLPPKGDMADFVALRSGQSPETIRAEIERAAAGAPVWTPPAETATATATGAPVAKPPEAGAPGAGFDSIRAALWGITQEKIGATEAHRKSAAAVVEWLHARGRFYHDAARRDFAGVMYFDATRKLLLPVQGDAFLAWLSDCLAVNRSERVFQFVASACETEGLSERATAIEPATYWAARPGAVYLSKGPGRVARITPAGVEIVDNGTAGVLFPVGACLEPWEHVAPVDPFEACALFAGMAAAAPHGPMLFKLWATALPSDGKTKPPACFTAPVGGGKTALVRGLFALLGMPETVNAVAKNGDGDFWAAVDAGGLVCFDNVDTRNEWLPDALAAAATAGTFTKRRLYTDADRVTLRARASIAVTSASPTFASDAGLADRLLVIRMNRRTGETAESALFDEVRANRDAGLSWIAATLSKALADAAPVLAGLNARHPDFAALAVRIGRAMGREAEAVAALRAAEADKGLFNLENDTVGAALLEMLAAGPFTGTAGELLEGLKAIDASFEGRLSDKRLGKRLSKLWPHLESTLHAAKERDGHTRTWIYSFRPPSVAGFAGFGEPFSEKSYARENIGTFTKTPLETPQTPQTAEPDLFDNAEEIDFEEGEI